MTVVRIDVLPDVAGHWSVTRDRIVDAEFNDRQRAIDYADHRAHIARAAGLDVQMEIHEPLGDSPK